MYGDTDVMRQRVDQLREQGLDIRVLADQLVARTEGIGWTGRAADSLRERIRDRAAHLGDTASRHESAAESLEKHLLEVDRLKDSIAGTQRRAAQQAADPDDPTTIAFTAPPAGHRDWLTVDLPGL